MATLVCEKWIVDWYRGIFHIDNPSYGVIQAMCVCLEIFVGYLYIHMYYLFIIIIIPAAANHHDPHSKPSVAHSASKPNRLSLCNQTKVFTAGSRSRSHERGICRLKVFTAERMTVWFVCGMK